MRRDATAVALALGAIGCGRSEPRPPPTEARAQPQPVPRPTRVPVAFTIAEVTPLQPVLAGARVIAPLALDGSGKQALTTACVIGADIDAATTAIADQYARAGWQAPTRKAGAFAADRAIADGTLQVRGRIRAGAACDAGELAIELAYTRMVALDVSSDRTAP